MRPAPDLPPFSSPKPSFDLPSPSLDPRTAAPATFFLSRSPHASDLESDSFSDSLADSKETMYGVQSIGETLSQSEMATGLLGHPDNQTRGSSSRAPDDVEEPKGTRRRSTLKPFGHENSSPTMRPPDADAVSRPLTPFNPDEPSSLPSSPKSISNQSLRPLDDISITDEINSQVIGSDDEDNNNPKLSPHLGPQGASQLIMPSIKMPSRRPFTEKGKAMGRFKILLGGASGSGKTSLIKSIVQTCEHIVHVDSLPQTTAATLERRRSSRLHSDPVSTRGALTEIYASTKPYPSWWSDLEDSRVLRRRKSIGDVVLERNICFVDTPATLLGRTDQTDAILQYMRQQLQRATTALTGATIDFQNLLAGNGGSQVDAILYLISNETLLVDVEVIRKLCDLTNVIPVVAKADTLSPEQIFDIKARFRQEAQKAGVKLFLFGDLPLEGLDGLDAQPPYAVSSEKTVDMEIMDASTLMSPDYVQPLIPSELETLVDRLFDRDNLSWMRHSAAKKLIQRRGELMHTPQPAMPLHNIISGTTTGCRATSGPSMGSSISSLGSSSPGYAMARITDYTRHEEQMAHVRLAQWATDLQRSLQNERDRYAALARGDRAVWLTERLSECVVDGSLLPISNTPGFDGLCMPSTQTEPVCLHVMKAHVGPSSRKHRMARLSSQDPLGVVGWIDDLGRRGWAIVQIVGSVGVVGGLALWLARTWGLPTRTLTDLQVEYRLGMWTGD